MSALSVWELDHGSRYFGHLGFRDFAAPASLYGDRPHLDHITKDSSVMAIGGIFAVFWRELTRDAVRPYRPELHYMRGPGPAWRAKHGLPPV